MGASGAKKTSTKRATSPSCPHCSTALTPSNSGNLKQTAAAFKISPQAFTQWISKGAPSVKKGDSVRNPWLFCWPCVRAWRKGKAEEKEDSSTTPGKEGDYWKEKIRHERAKASLAEIELAEKRGQLVNASALQKTLERVFSVIKKNLTAMPDKLAPRLLGLASVLEIKIALEQEIYDTLRNLGTIGDILPPPPDGSDGIAEDVPPPAPADAEPVGR